MTTNRFLLLLSLLILTNNAIGSDQVSLDKAQSEKPAIVKQAHEKKAYSKKAKRRANIKAMAIGVNKALEALKQDPFSDKSIWDQGYLQRDTEVASVLKKYTQGEYAIKVKELNFSGMNKEQIVTKLKAEGFERKEPQNKSDDMLGRGKDREFQESGDIYVYKDGSMIRIKDESKARHHRPQAYVVKAVLKNPEGPTTWGNEAFKVTKDGYPTPKGPQQSQGLKTHAPNSSGDDEDKGWADLIMEEVHIDIN